MIRKSVYFTGDIDPATGEPRLRRVERGLVYFDEVSLLDLAEWERIATLLKEKYPGLGPRACPDVAASDPTLANFYEPTQQNQGGEHA